MTRFKIQKLQFCVFLSIFLLSQVSTCNGNLREKHQELKTVPLNEEKKINEEFSKNVSQDATQKMQTNASVINNSKKTTFTITSNESSKTAITPVSTAPINNETHRPSVNTGALWRGILVIIGLSVLAVAYLVFRNFRLSKTRAQMVRKYGVLAHRQDVEMRPLPLDEDDEDDTTVFDASNIPVHGLQSQHS
ncbi:uncharacterized protein LOC131663683 [Phymastichus coffea]|uniref:uncharacterized protein LOC131663683 n=1 Tax=Phymastichus coffea TaxID=108790 RepID=UPI00273B463D|nr:uncharacterized protein LOC131663683 [Phymastichus coffea]